MRMFLIVVIASLAAALAPALVITFVSYADARSDLDFPLPAYLPLVFVVAFVVSLTHTLLLGLVAAGWLLRVGKFRLLPMFVVGLVIGVVPAAILHAFMTVSKINFQFVGTAGILGAIGAITFYLVYKSMSADKP